MTAWLVCPPASGGTSGSAVDGLLISVGITSVDASAGSSNMAAFLRPRMLRDYFSVEKSTRMVIIDSDRLDAWNEKKLKAGG